MSEPHKIPAASIDGVDLARIAARSPSDAREIERIDTLLGAGRETIEEFIQLCDLLHAQGETTKSEELLRCNVREDEDAVYQAYRRLYGTSADEAFERSIEAFALQFGVRLEFVKSRGFLRRDFTSTPLSAAARMTPVIDQFLSTPCHITFDYSPKGTVADIYSNAPDFPEERYLLLRFMDGGWFITEQAE